MQRSFLSTLVGEMLPRMFLLSNLGFYSIVQFSDYRIDLYQKKKLDQFYKYLPAAGDAVFLSFISLQPDIASGFAFQTCYGNRIHRAISQ